MWRQTKTKTETDTNMYLLQGLRSIQNIHHSMHGQFPKHDIYNSACVAWSSCIQWSRVRVVRWQSDLENAEEPVLPVCD